MMKSMVPDYNIKDTDQYQWMHMDAIIPLKINVLKGYLGHSPCNVSDGFDNGKPTSIYLNSLGATVGTWERFHLQMPFGNFMIWLVSFHPSSI